MCFQDSQNIAYTWEKYLERIGFQHYLSILISDMVSRTHFISSISELYMFPTIYLYNNKSPYLLRKRFFSENKEIERILNSDSRPHNRGLVNFIHLLRKKIRRLAPRVSKHYDEPCKMRPLLVR